MQYLKKIENVNRTDWILKGLMIAAAAPVGVNVAVFCQLYDRDYAYACETVTQSTVLSILTLPVMTALAGLVIR